MPNESSGKDLQIMCWSLLRQVAPSWRNLRHKVSTVRQTVSPKVLFIFFLLATFGQIVRKFSRETTRRISMKTSHVCSWVVCRLQWKIFLTSRMTLTFQGHHYIKSHFGPYLGSYWANCHQILTLGSLGRSLSINQKISWAVWTWDVRKRVTLATIMQKDVFDHNFWTKALGMTILASRYMFLRSRNVMVPFVLTYDLDLSRSWPLQNHIMGHISVINGQNVAKF